MGSFKCDLELIWTPWNQFSEMAHVLGFLSKVVFLNSGTCCFSAFAHLAFWWLTMSTLRLNCGGAYDGRSSSNFGVKDYWFDKISLAVCGWRYRWVFHLQTSNLKGQSPISCLFFWIDRTWLFITHKDERKCLWFMPLIIMQNSDTANQRIMLSTQCPLTLLPT